MKISALEVRPDALLATWSKTGRVTYPALWLRDNCPSAFHPQTEERVLDLLSLDDEPVLLDAERAGDEVILIGKGRGGDIRVEDLAAWAGTIPYELLCGIKCSNMLYRSNL